jgi:hypothetical protein
MLLKKTLKIAACALADALTLAGCGGGSDKASDTNQGRSRNAQAAAEYPADAAMSGFLVRMRTTRQARTMRRETATPSRMPFIRVRTEPILNSGIRQ